MKTVRLPSSVTRQNCSKINWSYSGINFANDIQKIISKHDGLSIDCGKRNYMFMLLPINPTTLPFSFPETNTLLKLMPYESDIFYLKAALREYVNSFEVINAEGERVYPEDII